MFTDSLTTESVEGSALSLQSIDDIHSGDGLPLGMFCIGDSITDDLFQEHLQDTSGFFVDETADSFYTTPASQTTNSGLSDTLDVITKNLPVTLSASFSQTLSSLTSSRHVDSLSLNTVNDPEMEFFNIYRHPTSDLDESIIFFFSQSDWPIAAKSRK